jgi:AcrR family transcriptional regulator
MPARPARPAPAFRPATRGGAPRARQERGVRTEEAILQATVRLLGQRGVHGTSLDLLAEEVGVAKSSILWHFGSKEELLLRVAERVFEETSRGLARDILALPTVEERGDALWRHYQHVVRDRPELRRVLLYLIFESAEGRPELRARLQRLYRGVRELFAEGLRGEVRDDMERQRLATISIATLDGLFLQWLLDPEAIDLAALHTDMRRLAELGRVARRHREAASERAPDHGDEA